MSPCFSPAPASTARFNTKRSLRRRVDDRPAVLRADGYGNQLIHKKEYSTCQIALTRQSIQSQHVTLFSNRDTSIEGAYLAISLLQDSAWEATEQLDLDEVELAEEPFSPIWELLDKHV